MFHAIIFLASFASVGHTQERTPQEAIKSQEGCFEVTFQYVETEGLINNYELRKPKKVQGN
jgi:hypothetical protein